MGAAVVGVAVVSAAVVGAAVVGAAVVGTAVVGAAVVGAALVGAAVVGAAVVGAAVDRATVVGATVVGSPVASVGVGVGVVEGEELLEGGSKDGTEGSTSAGTSVGVSRMRRCGDAKMSKARLPHSCQALETAESQSPAHKNTCDHRNKSFQTTRRRRRRCSRADLQLRTDNWRRLCIASPDGRVDESNAPSPH